MPTVLNPANLDVLVRHLLDYVSNLLERLRKSKKKPVLRHESGTFSPEDSSSTLLLNVGMYLDIHTEQHLWRQSSKEPPWSSNFVTPENDRKYFIPTMCRGFFHFWLSWPIFWASLYRRPLVRYRSTHMHDRYRYKTKLPYEIYVTYCSICYFRTCVSCRI